MNNDEQDNLLDGGKMKRIPTMLNFRFNEKKGGILCIQNTLQ